MAIVRTVLPRKGIIEPQHGTSYETDLDTNWQTIDSLLQDANDVRHAVIAAGTVAAWLSDIGVSGVVSGFDLSPSSNLIPGVASGVVYAQGTRWAASAPAPPPASPNSTSYLWWNSVSGFYFNSSGIADAPADALIGTVNTNATQVTSISDATKIYGLIPVVSAAPGNFSVMHSLGRTPLGAAIYMTSAGALWFQSGPLFDASSIYLTASDAAVSASIQVW